MIVLIVLLLLISSFGYALWYVARDAERQSRRLQHSARSNHPAGTARVGKRRLIPGDDLIGRFDEPARWDAFDDHQLARLLKDAAAR